MMACLLLNLPENIPDGDSGQKRRSRTRLLELSEEIEHFDKTERIPKKIKNLIQKIKVFARNTSFEEDELAEVTNMLKDAQYEARVALRSIQNPVLVGLILEIMELGSEIQEEEETIVLFLLN